MRFAAISLLVLIACSQPRQLASGVSWNASNLRASLKDAEGQCKPLARSAVVHELIHVVLMATTGNGDPDHADGVRYGTEWTPMHDDLERTVNAWLEESLQTPMRQEPDGKGNCFNPCSGGVLL